MALANTAAFLVGAGAPLEIREAPIPDPAADEIVVENKAVAINPIDSIIGQKGFLVQKFPVILGMDSAGLVVCVGSKAAKFYSVGDRVLAFTESIFSPRQDKGGFQKYSVVRTITACKLPNNLSFVEGSTLSLGIFTAAVGLFHKEHSALDMPRVPKRAQNGKTVLIWGGASSVGSHAIQMAVAAGYHVVTTASAKNFDVVRKSGATDVIDYRKSTIVEDAIAVLSGTQFVGTFLAAASGVSFKHASRITKALDGAQHVVSAPLYPMGFASDVKSTWTDLGVANYSDETLRVARYVFHEYLPEALAQEAIRIIPRPRVLGSGLEVFQSALNAMADGVSAEKLVVELS